MIVAAQLEFEMTLPVITIDRRCNSDWTQERMDLLAELYTQGSTAWVARELNARTGSSFTRNSCIGKARRMGLSQPEQQPEGWKTLDRVKRARTHKKKPRKPRSPWTGWRHGAPLPPTHVSEPIPILPFLGVTFDELTEKQCRFPRGERAPYLFCGQPRIEGSPYCAACHDVTHFKIEEKRVESVNNYLHRFYAA